MSPSSTTPLPATVTRRELSLLGLLALAGIVGAGLAYFHIARLRLDLATARQERAQKVARLHAENERLRPDASAADRDASSLLASDASVTVHPADSRAERMASLLALAKALRRGQSASRAMSEAMMAESQLRAARGNSRIPPTDISAYLLIGDELAPRFGELFMLEPNKIAELHGALRATREQLDALAVAKTQLKDNGDGSFTLETAALTAEEQAPARAHFTSTFRRIMDDDAYEAFAVLNGLQPVLSGQDGDFGKMFDRTGSVQRTATISKDARGRYSYQMKFGPNGAGFGSGSAATLDELRSRVGGGVKALPPGF